MNKTLKDHSARSGGDPGRHGLICRRVCNRTLRSLIKRTSLFPTLLCWRRPQNHLINYQQLPQIFKRSSRPSGSVGFVHENYVDQPVDDVALMRGVINGMMNALGDQHSSYMDPEFC